MSNFDQAKKVNQSIMAKLNELQSLIEESETDDCHHLFLGIQLVKAFNTGLFEDVDALDSIIRKGVLLNETAPSQFVYIDEYIQDVNERIEEALEDEDEF